MGKVVLFLGPSASGKDTIIRRLVKENKYAFKEIIMHTTRPMRAGEINGREYFFDTIAEKDELIRQNKIIEIREYNTRSGIWYYYTVEDEIDLQNSNYIGSNTLIGLDKYLAWGGVQILPIFIQSEDKIRIHRALEREDKEANPKYDGKSRPYFKKKIIKLNLTTRKMFDKMLQVVVHYPSHKNYLKVGLKIYQLYF